MRKKVLFTFCLISLLICGCTQAAQTESSTEKSYPVSEGYPLEILDPSGYPVDNIPQIGTRGPDFNITEPVNGGETIVQGSGPANVPINLVDVFMNGELLGSTVVDDNGNFSFSLDKPLVTGHSIGLMLGDISKTDLSESDFMYNENYYDIPLIGILFDFVVVY